LRETRAAYRDLINKNVFLANATTFGLNVPPPALSLTPRLTVTAALQSVMNSASERFTALCRCGCAVSPEKGIAVMQDLYEVQKSLVGVLNTSFTGVFDTNTAIFASLLNAYLDTAIPGTPPNNLSLKAAIQASGLKAAIAAQNAINGLALNWSGEAVTGNLQVTYQGSNRGLTLVAGDTTPFLYTYRVTNMTNRTLDIQLSAGFDAPRADWSANVTLRDATGAAVSSVTLEPFSPNNQNNPAAFRDIIVAVVTPVAPIGTTGTLRFRAEVPPPAGVADEETTPQPLVIGEGEEPEPATTVTFLGPVEIDGNPNSAPVGDEITYTFRFRFHTTQGQTTRDFRLFVDITSPSSVAGLYTIRFGNRQSETDTSVISPTRRATRTFPLTNDLDDLVIMHVIPQSGAPSAPLTFAARIQSTTDTTLRDVTPPQTIAANPN